MAVVGESTSICFYNANTGIKTNTIKDAHRLRFIFILHFYFILHYLILFIKSKRNRSR